MVYWDGQRYVTRSPTIIPDIRTHVANWQRFKKETGRWPLLSIAMYVLRFVLIMAAVVVALSYGVVGHNWTRDRYYLTLFTFGMPLLFVWFILERKAWNRDLRREGLASENEVWSVTQFPEK